jgi:hypothetical protein
MADLPKLATRWKAEEERGTIGLTKQPKHCFTSEANLIPGSKQGSESPAMMQEEDQQGAPLLVKLGTERGRDGSGRVRAIATNDGDVFYKRVCVARACPLVVNNTLRK